VLNNKKDSLLVFLHLFCWTLLSLTTGGGKQACEYIATFSSKCLALSRILPVVGMTTESSNQLFRKESKRLEWPKWSFSCYKENTTFTFEFCI